MAHAEVTMDRHETRGRKKLHHIEVHPAANGGHMIMHHYQSEHGYQEPKTHVFGPEDGHEVLMHIAKHAKIKHEMAAEHESAAEDKTEEGEE